MTDAPIQPVRRLGLAYNPTNDAAIELRERAAGWCVMRGVDHWAAPAADLDTIRRELTTSDALLVLGGDGTFLLGARAVVDVDVPLLGVNVGKVGFLSKVEAEGLTRVLGQLVAGDFRLEARMALEGRILRGGRSVEPGERLIALNDIVVARGSLARVCRLQVAIDGIHLATYVADGLVVASPTGSTGYSFSVGGPIVDPESRNLIVSPIAGYLSAIRSVVVEPTKVVTCRVNAAHEALVSVDGREDIPLTVGDVVEVRAIDRPVRFIEPTGSLPFWDLMRRKAELLPS
jgi:NAD+ kinase